MKKYRVDEVSQALSALGIGRGDSMLVHSSLFALGLLEGVAPRDVPHVLRDTLIAHVGEAGTLAAPTFTFAFCKGVAFDPANAPSVAMGQLSEAVRQHPAAKRSKHPMQSVAAIGRLAEEICAPDPEAAYAIGGTFHLILEHDFHLVFFGASVQAGSLVHYAEERVQVPYRYFKAFTAPYVMQGQTIDKTYQMYVRDTAMDPRLALAPIEHVLRERAAWREAALGGGRVSACSARAFVDAAEHLLRRDPWALVANPVGGTA